MQNSPAEERLSLVVIKQVKGIIGGSQQDEEDALDSGPVLVSTPLTPSAVVELAGDFLESSVINFGKVALGVR